MSIQKLFDLKGRVAVVTGGSIGIGQQMAEGLAEAGANVVIAARKVERCEAEADKIMKTLGVKALPVRCDVSDQESVNNLIATTVKEFGRIDIMVNNAGVVWGQSAVDLSIKGWRKCLDINLNGCFFGCQAAGREMIKQKYGKIINITSVTGVVGFTTDIDSAECLSYQVSKGGILIMTKDLAVKWARYGINVNSICPGYFPTEVTQYTIGSEQGDALMDTHIPMKRWGGDEDLKGAVVYLASEASAYVTGHNLAVDGGYLSM
ncbi:MAG: glucose 1-dehydrogenase [Syntrophomonadaceae bacterium]|nr:glucose 1-dehydrogenase [Syntrophomonadaceae bacterium]